MNYFNVIIIGNGFDLYCGMGTTFSNFMDTQFDLEYVQKFLHINDHIYLRQNERNNFRMENKYKFVLFEEELRNINTWNDLERILDETYVRIEGEGTGLKYKKKEAEGLDDFMHQFSENFKSWISSKNIVPLTDIPYVDGFSKNDIVINLNFTNTIPVKYTNVYKIHYVEEHDYCFIGPKSIKNNSSDIQEFLNYILSEIEEISQFNTLDKVYVFGANMHSEYLVDEHIVECINEIRDTDSGGFKEEELVYIGKDFTFKDKMRMKTRFIGNITPIDVSTVPIQQEIKSDDGLPF